MASAVPDLAAMQLVISGANQQAVSDLHPAAPLTSPDRLGGGGSGPQYQSWLPILGHMLAAWSGQTASHGIVCCAWFIPQAVH